MRSSPPLLRVRPAAALVLLAVVAVGGWSAPVAAAAPAWRWPVDPPVVVLRGFEPPPGPYAPGHRGVDLAAPAGTAVRAAGAGTVVIAGDVAGRPVVVVAHGPARTDDELRTTYEPVVASVPVGRSVHAGEVIGQVGRWPGHCADECLHWGLRRGSVYLDPRSLLAGPVRLLPVGPPQPLAGPVDPGAAAARVTERPVPAAAREPTSPPNRSALHGRTGRLPGPAGLDLAAVGVLSALGGWVARHRIATRGRALIARPRGSPP